MVVDTRETWKEWFQRQRNFGEVPLVPIEDLEEKFKPHSSFYNRMINIANGIDPTPREQREERRAGANLVDSDIEQCSNSNKAGADAAADDQWFQEEP